MFRVCSLIPFPLFCVIVLVYRSHIWNIVALHLNWRTTALIPTNDSHYIFRKTPRITTPNGSLKQDQILLFWVVKVFYTKYIWVTLIVSRLNLLPSNDEHVRCFLRVLSRVTVASNKLLLYDDTIVHVTNWNRHKFYNATFKIIDISCLFVLMIGLFFQLYSMIFLSLELSSNLYYHRPTLYLFVIYILSLFKLNIRFHFSYLVY